MSEPTDIKALDEYLKGGSDVSQRYRELGRDEVPPELDRRVLAASRDAVANEGAQRSRSWLRWSTPIAVAASVVLVVTVVLERGVQDDMVVVQQAPSQVWQARSDVADDKATDAAAEAKLAEEARQQPGAAPSVPEAPAVPPSQSPSKPEAAAKVENQRFGELAPPQEVTVEARRTLRDQAVQTTPVAVTTMEALPQAASPTVPAPAAVEQMSANKSAERSEAEADTSDMSEVAVTGSRVRRGTGRTAGPRNTISSSAFASEPQAASDEHSDPEEWLEEIRELRRAGKTAEADREWQRFQKAFPDFRVADDDIARKKP